MQERLAYQGSERLILLGVTSISILSRDPNLSRTLGKWLVFGWKEWGNQPLEYSCDYAVDNHGTRQELEEPR